MSDPLADVRAADLLAAIPDEVSNLAASFRSAASESASTAQGLSAAQHDGTWTGRAASAFRRAIGRLPGRLERVRAGFAGVADALDAYEPQLVEVQRRFVQVAGELDDLESRVGPAAGSAEAARQQLRAAMRDQHVSPRALREAELAVARADGSVGSYHREIEQLRARAFTLLDEFASLRDTCRAAIVAAQHGAIIRPAGGSGTTVIDLTAPIATAGAAASGAAASGGAAVNAAFATPAQGEARVRLAAMIGHANALLGTPYVSGGGHGSWGSGGGLDCSGFVSSVLHAGGYLSSPQTTEGFAGQPHLAAGHGQHVTIYDRTACGENEHVIIDLNGQFYESGGGGASGGAPFVHTFTPSPEYLASFHTVLHPVGL